MLTWAYHGTDTLAVNIGLSCELIPPELLLSEYWEKNHRALLQIIQQVIHDQDIVFLGELFRLNIYLVCVMSRMSGSFVCEGYGD